MIRRIAHRRLAGLLALTALVLALAGAGVAAAVGPWKSEPTHVTAWFDNSVGVYKESDVRVLGVKVGHVTRVKPQGDKVQVDFVFDRDVAVAPDTRAVIVAPTMVADRYVQLTKPVDTGAHLADGAVIPIDRTDTPVEIDRLYKSLDDVATVLGPKGANRDGALSDLVRVAADNMEGNGARTRTLLTNLGAAARTLSESDDDAFAAVESLDKLAAVMQTNDGHVRSVAERVARVTGVLAQDRKTIEAALDELASALTLVQDFVHDNRAAIAHSVDRLSDATVVFVEQRAVIGQILGALPPAVGGLLGAYDAARQVLVGRADPLDATLGHGPDLSGIQDHAPPKLPYPMPGGTP